MFRTNTIIGAFHGQFARALFTNYFLQQEHFRTDHFIRKLTSNPSNDLQNEHLFTTDNAPVAKFNEIHLTRKVMIFTRTTSFVIGLNEQSKQELFGGFNDQTYIYG